MSTQKQKRKVRVNDLDIASLPKTKKGAKDQGLTHFYTGEPCTRGHIAPRLSLNSCCTECFKENTKRFYAKRIDDKDLDFKKKLIIGNIKGSCERKGIPFELTVDNVVWNTVCPVFGCELDYFTRGKPGPNAASIDKIVPSLGYIPSNVVVISHRANQIKTNASIHELEQVLNYLRKHDTGNKNYFGLFELNPEVSSLAGTKAEK